MISQHTLDQYDRCIAKCQRDIVQLRLSTQQVKASIERKKRQRALLAKAWASFTCRRQYLEKYKVLCDRSGQLKEKMRTLSG